MGEHRFGTLKGREKDAKYHESDVRNSLAGRLPPEARGPNPPYHSRHTHPRDTDYHSSHRGRDDHSGEHDPRGHGLHRGKRDHRGRH
jgi:hypothetical protein